MAKVFSEQGQYDQAHFHMKKVLEADPKFNIDSRRKQNPFKDPAVTEREMEALRKQEHLSIHLRNKLLEKNERRMSKLEL